MRVFVILPLLLLSHCGYNWGHQTRSLPGDHTTVYVELFKNPTKEIGLEAQFSQALIHELERSGFASVSSKDAAEIIIKGDILSATVTGQGADSSNFITKDYSSADLTKRSSETYTASYFTAYVVQVAVNLRAIRSRDKQMIWQTTLSGSKGFQASRLKRQGLRSSNVLYNEARKKQTIKLVAKEMMSDAFDRLTENF